jgi:hypothetical protein
MVANTPVTSQKVFNQATAGTSGPQFVNKSWTAVQYSLREEVREMSYLTTLSIAKIT